MHLPPLSWVDRHPVLVLFMACLAGLIALTGYKFSRNLQLICPELGRALNEQEVLKIAIDNVLQRESERARSGKLDKNYMPGAFGLSPLPPNVRTPVKIYEDAPDFFRQNHNCCSVKLLGPPDLMARLLGWRSYSVYLDYRRYIVGPTPFASARINVGLCGGTWDEALYPTSDKYSE